MLDRWKGSSKQRETHSELAALTNEDETIAVQTRKRATGMWRQSSVSLNDEFDPLGKLDFHFLAEPFLQ